MAFAIKSICSSVSQSRAARNAYAVSSIEFRERLTTVSKKANEQEYENARDTGDYNTI
jgi:hypothetical protein